MAGRGFPPAPTEVKIHRGETRPSHLNLTAPRPRHRPPRMPRDLLPEARPIWRAVLREMPPGVILAVDADLLRLYSEAMARYRQATAIYARSGTGLIARRGARGGHGDEVVRHPIHQIVRDWSQEARALATELGLSPTSRARLHVPGEAGLSEGIERELGVPLNRLHVLPAEAPSTPTRKAP